MLKRLTVQGFKSLDSVAVELPQLTVFFGPNAVGKSNLLDAVQALSRIGTARTLSDALAEPIRGYAVEAFALPSGGLAALLSADVAKFELEADLSAGKDAYRYRVAVGIQPRSGSLSVRDEYLAPLARTGEPKGKPAIEVKEGKIRLRRKSSGKPRYERLGQNFATLSDLRLGGVEYRHVERARNELSGWRTYYLDPRVAMRSAQPPSDARDIGVLGENIAPFLYRLRDDHEKHFDAVRRTLRSIIPGVEDLTVDLDKRRGTLDIMIRQGGTDFSSRIISEGTLRVLALCAIAVNPWSGSLIAFEEPENGVHPRRLELIAQLLCSLALEHRRQILVTTHSPLFCEAILKQQVDHPGQIALFRVRRGRSGTEVESFEVAGPLFRDAGIRQALTAATEDGLFESLLMRGLLDE